MSGQESLPFLTPKNQLSQLAASSGLDGRLPCPVVNVRCASILFYSGIEFGKLTTNPPHPHPAHSPHPHHHPRTRLRTTIHTHIRTLLFGNDYQGEKNFPHPIFGWLKSRTEGPFESAR